MSQAERETHRGFLTLWTWSGSYQRGKVNHYCTLCYLQ